MKPKTMILMVVAVVCGLAASYMTSRLLADKGGPPPANTVKVLVAKARINAWTPIKKPEEMFVEKEVPEGTFSPKCITDFKDLKNQALKAPLSEEMPLTKDDLLSEATAGLVGALHNGERGIAIRVTPESLVGGFVLPGSKVDVMMTLKRGDGDSSAQIIMQDMTVLAVDQKNTRDDGQQAILGNTVTLAAKPEQSERLSLAASLGDLRLLLRTPLDQEKPTYKAVHIADLPHGLNEKEAGQTDSTDVASTGSVGPVLPTLPTLDKKPAPTPAPAPEPVVEKAPELPPPVTHTLRVESGGDPARWHNVSFVWDDKNNCWVGGVPGKKADVKKAEDQSKDGEADTTTEESPKPKAPAKAKNAPKTPVHHDSAVEDAAKPVG
jgi:Flp pilus assembly protein CpaB